MWKIARPHDLVDAHLLARDAHTDRIAIETPVAVFAGIFARHAAEARQSSDALGPVLLPAVFIVHLVQPIGHPPELHFGDVNFQLGKSFEGAAPDHLHDLFAAAEAILVKAFDDV